MINLKPKKINRILLTTPFSYENKRFNIGVDPVVVRHAGQEIKTGITFPIGLAYMAATLLENNYEVCLLDPIAEKIPLGHINNMANWTDAIVMPFSAAHMKDIKKFREDFRNKYFILCGYAKFIHEVLLKEDYCDVILDVESELIISELINKYPEIKDIQGIICSIDGEIVSNIPAPLIDDLDNLPFPERKFLNPKLYWEIPFFGQPTAWILGSRGCSYNCVFCTKVSNNYRFRSAPNIVDEIESVINGYNIRNFAFFDDNFNLNKKFVKAVCNEILDRNIKINWSCSGRADYISEDIVKLMKKSGCVEIKIGLESANDNILQYLQKETSIEEIKQGLEILNKIDLSYSLQCIFGSPMENYKTVRNTINFVKEYKPLFASFNVLTPLPGSILFDESKKEISLKQLQKFDILHTDFPLGHYSGRELREILKKAYLHYYLSLTYVRRIFKEITKRPLLVFGVLKTLLKQSFYVYKSIIR